MDQFPELVGGAAEELDRFVHGDRFGLVGDVADSVAALVVAGVGGEDAGLGEQLDPLPGVVQEGGCLG